MRLGAAAVVAALLALPIAAKAVLQSETLAAGKLPSHAAADPATGRVFVSSASAITVLDSGGRATTLAVSDTPGHIAVSAVHRRAVVVHPTGSHATLIDADTLQTRTVMTGTNPMRALIVERTGHAYVVGSSTSATTTGLGSGSVTEIDLRSGFARTFPVPGFWPENAALDPSGTRLYLVGNGQQHEQPWQAGYVQAFDLHTKTIPGAPVQLGRHPRHVMVSPAGDTVYVLGHVDWTRNDVPASDRRRNGVRPAVFVLDALTFGVKRTFPLPEARDLERSPLFAGQAELHADTIYALDAHAEQMTVIDLANSRLENVELEAPAHALAVNAAAKTVMVTMGAAGIAGVFSLAGNRLDTVPIGRSAQGGELASQYAIAVDAGSGTAWVTNGHAGTVSQLRRASREATPQRVDYTDLWSSPGNPGWGVFIDQQGATLFATLFTYDTAGKPTWYFVSNGRRQADGAFAGELYRARGATPEAPRKVGIAGTMRFEPTADGGAMLTYYIDGMLHRRALERFRFSRAQRECRWAVGSQGTSPARTNFTSLWSNPADPGWGLAVAHQGDSAFAVLFTYDEEARPTWVVMSNGRGDVAGLFSGDIYRPSEKRVARAGQMSITFSSAESGTLRYRLGGLDFRAPVLRQTFSRLTTHCTP